MSTHKTNSFDSQKAIQHPKVGMKKQIHPKQSWNFHVPLSSAIACATAAAG